MAHESAQEESSLSKQAPPPTVTEKDPSLNSIVGGGGGGGSPRTPSRSPAVAEKEDKPAHFTSLPEGQKLESEPALTTCWAPVLPYQGSSRDVIRSSPLAEPPVFQYNPPGHPVSLNVHESSRPVLQRLPTISNPPPLISTKHPSVLERPLGSISQQAKVPIGSITMGLPLTMDPKKLVPFPGVKQEQLSPRSQAGQPESLAVQTSQENSVLRGTSLGLTSGGSISKGTPSTRPLSESPITYRGSIMHGTPAEVLYKGTITRIIGEDSPGRAEKVREDALPKGHVIYEGKKGHVLTYDGGVAAAAQCPKENSRNPGASHEAGGTKRTYDMMEGRIPRGLSSRDLSAASIEGIPRSYMEASEDYLRREAKQLKRENTPPRDLPEPYKVRTHENLTPLKMKAVHEGLVATVKEAGRSIHEIPREELRRTPDVSLMTRPVKEGSITQVAVALAAKKGGVRAHGSAFGSITTGKPVSQDRKLPPNPRDLASSKSPHATLAEHHHPMSPYEHLLRGVSGVDLYRGHIPLAFDPAAVPRGIPLEAAAYYLPRHLAPSPTYPHLYPPYLIRGYPDTAAMENRQTIINDYITSQQMHHNAAAATAMAQRADLLRGLSPREPSLALNYAAGIIDLSQVPHLPVLVPPSPGTSAASMDRITYIHSAPQPFTSRHSSSPLSPGAHAHLTKQTGPSLSEREQERDREREREKERKKSVLTATTTVEHAPIWRPGTDQNSGRSSAHSNNHKHSPVSPRTQENIQQRPSVLHNTNMKMMSSEYLAPSVLRSSSSSSSSSITTTSPIRSSSYSLASSLRSAVSGTDSYASATEMAPGQKDSCRAPEAKTERLPMDSSPFPSKLPPGAGLEQLPSPVKATEPRALPSSLLLLLLLRARFEPPL
ncbi:hypothetical protein JRQ81_007808 [Phrynocephalus forsythii]|uniref:Nuclear receptor corepressor 2 n=1 Tax=Phrynocephalus forsythii TaxID=171643 RepID=A0A9Q0XCG0_9SAUR|nr:hypothetical protein JRQ81_007808 [Phrynocephalus forsythii]